MSGKLAIAALAVFAVFTIAAPAVASDNPPYAAGHEILWKPSPTDPPAALAQGLCFVSPQPSPDKEQRDGTYEHPYDIQEAPKRCGKDNPTIFLREGSYAPRPILSLQAGQTLTSSVPLNGHPTATRFISGAVPIITPQDDVLGRLSAKEHLAGLTMAPGSTLRRIRIETRYPYTPPVRALVSGEAGEGQIVVEDCALESRARLAPAFALRAAGSERLGNVVVRRTTLTASGDLAPALDVSLEGVNAGLGVLNLADCAITARGDHADAVSVRARRATVGGLMFADCGITAMGALSAGLHVRLEEGARMGALDLRDNRFALPQAMPGIPAVIVLGAAAIGGLDAGAIERNNAFLTAAEDYVFLRVSGRLP